MKRQSAAVGVALMVLGLVAGGHVALAQTGPADGSWSVPRTSAGHPDLQGVWANNSATPLERPAAFGDTAELTDEERAELEQRVSGLLSGGDAYFGDGLVAAALQEDSPWLTFDAGTGNYGQAWMVARDIDNRTSLIVDPPNGRLPALSSSGPGPAGGARSLSGGPPGRFLGRPDPERAVHHVRLPQLLRRLQQLLPDRADGAPRRDPPGADSRRPHHPARRPPARR